MCVIGLQDELQEKIYTNQTEKNPVRSSQGNQYLMIMCKMDSDAILFEPMWDRTAGKMINTYQALVDCLNACRIYLRHYVLDVDKTAKEPANLWLDQYQCQHQNSIRIVDY